MTCTDAIAEVFSEGSDVLSARQVIEKIYARYQDRPWKESTIQAHLVGLSVNHSSGHHYPTLHRRAFLYSPGRGLFRRWHPERDEDILSNVDETNLDQESDGLEGAVDTTVSLERDLERALLQNLDQIELGLSLYRKQGLSGQQLDTGIVGRIDILAIDANGHLVVIELKAGKVADRVCGQVLRYMGWVGDQLAKGQPVRGIIVASEFDESIKYAVKAMPTVTLKRYEVRFDIFEA